MIKAKENVCTCTRARLIKRQERARAILHHSHFPLMPTPTTPRRRGFFLLLRLYLYPLPLGVKAEEIDGRAMKGAADAGEYVCQHAPRTGYVCAPCRRAGERIYILPRDDLPPSKTLIKEVFAPRLKLFSLSLYLYLFFFYTCIAAGGRRWFLCFLFISGLMRARGCVLSPPAAMSSGVCVCVCVHSGN